MYTRLSLSLSLSLSFSLSLSLLCSALLCSALLCETVRDTIHSYMCTRAVWSITV
ncbi:hypothetical protein EJ05DRAFT_475223 [Pseudovirgaria hyperparasitica]|uniref:Uncharacterized protein n=1 Tax=Pseudovirgaria hyperparasitica TaxID=470096 RepID=A0A6A6WAX7_9PEZI|nr:uncharacterized protein EJ05DRAFT_475223 [Pseudovirgaria hyperparasitica]KAF2758986.1 hypothetical protein EJ05DRAFT_475223 [Pseudovirgaria hyperparasitica]